MRMNLKVPFAEKDEAKKLGARWDAARKLWFVDGKADLAPFTRWSPTPHAAAAGDASVATAVPVRQQATGKVIVGSEYVELPRVCACLPWEACAQCLPTALPGR